MSNEKAVEIGLDQSTSPQELMQKISEMKNEVAAELRLVKEEKKEAQTVTVKETETSETLTVIRDILTTNMKTPTVEKPRSSLEELKRFRVIRKHDVLRSNTTGTDMECSPAKHFKLDNLLTERKSIIEIHLKNESIIKPSNSLQESICSLKEQSIIELDKIREQKKLQEQSNEESAVLSKQYIEKPRKDGFKANQQPQEMEQENDKNIDEILMQEPKPDTRVEEMQKSVKEPELESEPESVREPEPKLVQESTSKHKQGPEFETKLIQESELESELKPTEKSENRSNECNEKYKEENNKPTTQKASDNIEKFSTKCKEEDDWSITKKVSNGTEETSKECNEENREENDEQITKELTDSTVKPTIKLDGEENKEENDNSTTKEAFDRTEQYTSECNEYNEVSNDKSATNAVPDKTEIESNLCNGEAKQENDKPAKEGTFDKTDKQSNKHDSENKEEEDKTATNEPSDITEKISNGSNEEIIDENNKSSMSNETVENSNESDGENKVANSKPMTREISNKTENHSNEYDGGIKIEIDKPATIETSDRSIVMDIDCIKLEKTDTAEEKSEANAVIEAHEENTNMSITAEEETQHPPEQLSAEEESLDRQLRASCESFLQHLPCFKLQQSKTEKRENEPPKPSIPKCRECRRRSYQNAQASSLAHSDVYCRFYEFRRLQYNADGELLVAGFPNPYTDPTTEDLNIWQPDEHTPPTAGYMDIQVCRYILLHAGDQFCYLWRQEAEALKLHENPNSTIAWKKVVQGVREICDVCDTTLFNFHWTCDKCGFGVCADCFKDRKEKRTCRKTRDKRGRDEYHWLLCAATGPPQQKHELCELMLTQIIAGDALNVLGRLLHDVRTLWQVPQVCGCLLSKQEFPPDSELSAFIQDMIKESQLKQQTSASSLATEETLRKQARMEKLHAKKLEFARARGIDYVPGRVWTKQTLGKDPITTAFDNFKHINFLRKGLAGLRRFLPPRAMTLAHSNVLAPGVPHEWLCDGKLLRLTNAMHPDNRILFQEVWKCGQPVMISEVARSLNLDLWRPEAFCRDFGDKPNDLINCLNGNLVPNQPMRHFWEGFQCIKKRLLDAHGKPMLLKLKDWPPGDDFAEILPTRYADLMKGLPMPEYTLRTGNLNIASCLPKMFVPPDLGPKMYNAYGSALHPDKGTTNLHLDISDAVNIMVYVGIPQDSDSKSQLTATQRAIAMGGCEYLTRVRSISPHVLPGALWHIFPARDADKIRDLLNRVTLEKGFRLEPDHDPIHDQNWYLDDKLRARLFKEYGVEGYPIVQCLGDAVFIPAGAPHQVQNLHNCIKVAEDFVSPENITHCYHLTHEFRRLSHSHTNHEDKLQIKNIIYHAIKDCCTILVRALHERIDAELELQAAQEAKLQMRADDAVEFISNLTTEETKKAIDEAVENSI